jgi:hypothetical protein
VANSHCIAALKNSLFEKNLFLTLGAEQYSLHEMNYCEKFSSALNKKFTF